MPQSMLRMSSPLAYGRKSLNTMPAPTRRERCTPFNCPCTGRRVCRLSSSSLRSKLSYSKAPGVATFRSFRDAVVPPSGGRRRHALQDVFDDRVGAHALGLGIEVEQQAVAQSVERDAANIFAGDIESLG